MATMVDAEIQGHKSSHNPAKRAHVHLQSIGLPVWILILAFLIRIAFGVFSFSRAEPFFFEYGVIANSLLENGYFGFNMYGAIPFRPTSFMPPLYPFLVYIARLFFGNSDQWFLLLVQSLALTYSVYLSHRMALHFFRSTTVAFWAALGTALYPMFIVPAAAMSTWTGDIVCFQATLFHAIEFKSTSKLKHAWMSGIWGCLAGLLRTQGFVLVLFIGIYLLFQKRLDANLKWRSAIALAICLGIAIVPWTIRNYTVHKAFVPMSTNNGYNLYIGNFKGAPGHLVPLLDGPILEKSAKMPEPEASKYLQGLAIKEIQSDYESWYRTLVQKVQQVLWFKSEGVGKASGMSVPNIAYEGPYALLLALALVGFVVGKIARSRDVFLLLIASLYYLAVPIAFFVITRFRTPVETILIPFAALGLVFVTAKFKLPSEDWTPDK